jgi:hypothetical protein
MRELNRQNLKRLINTLYSGNIKTRNSVLEVLNKSDLEALIIVAEDLEYFELYTEAQTHIKRLIREEKIDSVLLNED